ncbi:uracil-DNA glycosylase [Fodinicola acaciae]|uniref:uracil-DNA glycosylase n=1 Tax=Fodinicola acaciae TaxID=2681555 RepID=UPI0024835041|nr:uracil-DNA glycosylase [Fodinicola acaciae]
MELRYLSAPERAVPVAKSPAGVRRLAGTAESLDDLDDAVACCRACPRLVAWREKVAVEKRASFATETYWGRPAPGFGPADARIAVLGLAPAAHGANRTGRVFTGDRSGDWLFASMHRTGLANQALSVDAGDGLALIDTRVVAAVRCAPPENKPTPAERDSCQPWLVRELALLRPTLKVIVVLGGFGWAALWPALEALAIKAPKPRPKFGHGVEFDVSGITVLGCFHPSQQNTFTGRLTEPMMDGVFQRAAKIAAG